MDIAFIYIGLAQSVFSSILFFFKQPFKIADRILGVWMILIAGLFVLNVIKLSYNISTDLWPISSNLSITFPIFLFLYTKYIVKEYDRFKLGDLIHFIPLLIGIIIVLIHLPYEIVDSEDFIKAYGSQIKALDMIGEIFRITLWFYSFSSLFIIYIYRKKIANYYSYESGKINLVWLVVLILTFFLVYNFIIYISGIHIGERFIPHVEKFRSGALLLFVYIVSIWGFRQNQLSTNIKPPRLNLHLKKQNEPGRYKKSGLKKEQAEKYKQHLIDYMNSSQAWKDNELSIAKLSAQTDIPKHYITQVLNENIGKNFYTFINEYRIEYAMKLIKSNEYDSWSFVAIALESGFNSKTAFNNFFKKYVGVTPSEFKKNRIS